MTAEEQNARQAWITYSTPLWKRAGRSDAWIAQNINAEWTTSKQDILRRYLAGDFAQAVAAAKKMRLGASFETVKNYLPWIGLGIAGLILIIVLRRRKEGEKNYHHRSSP